MHISNFIGLHVTFNKMQHKVIPTMSTMHIHKCIWFLFRLQCGCGCTHWISRTLVVNSYFLLSIYFCFLLPRASRPFCSVQLINSNQSLYWLKFWHIEFFVRCAIQLRSILINLRRPTLIFCIDFYKKGRKIKVLFLEITRNFFQASTGPYMATELP